MDEILRQLRGFNVRVLTVATGGMFFGTVDRVTDEGVAVLDLDGVEQYIACQHIVRVEVAR